ncbi:hypothetical protein DFH27DRAFT_551782 [Peziza echinospora]|nr:hypothetical protein DFH27DRAFT_551782 [Peziza echinospora]
MSTSPAEQDSTAPKLHRQQFSLPQLPTTSVTIYPARAAVVRNIKGVVLKPGRNEIILHQLTPAADENSIKVSGRLVSRDGGRAKVLLIADMTVDLVKPPAAPSTSSEKAEASSSNEVESDEGEEDDITVSDTETPSLADISTEIKQLENKLKIAREEISSCHKQLWYLERWGDALTTEKPSASEAKDTRSTTNVKDYLVEYADTRQRLMQEQYIFKTEVEAWEKELGKKNKAKASLVKKLTKKKEKAKEERKRIKEEERERRREEGKDESINTDKDPEKWFRVRVWIDREDEELDASGNEKVAQAEDAEGELEITYTVTQAGWVSRYDIVISSSGDPDSGGKPGKPNAYLTYHAHFQNRTFETWKDAMITLSTSQTAYTGLADAAPVIEPWKVHLVSWSNHVGMRNSHFSNNDASAVVKERSQGGLYSSQEKGYIAQEKKEIAIPQMQMQQQAKGAMMRKKSAFGGSSNAGNYENARSRQRLSSPPGNNLRMSEVAVSPSAARRGGGGGYANVYEVLSDSEEFKSKDEGISTPVDSDDSESEDDTASVADTLTPSTDPSPAPPKPQFVTQGLTSSYSIPHPMTIPSSHTTSAELNAVSGAVRRHTILTIPLTHIQLSYVATPKLRAAAYLKARIMNVSTTTLRKGAVGITLDGTFIGSTTLSRTVYPGSVFSFPLGIDESVTVNYAKPTIKRHIQRSAANKLFSSVSWGRGHQEMVARYGRSTVIRNNRLDRGAIELVITDQVPVSEDGKLVVVVTWPRGLRPPIIPITAAGGRRGAIDEGEIAEDNGDGGDEGATLKLGNPIRTGTGVYVEGFQVRVDEDSDPVIVRTATTSNAPLAAPQPQSQPAGLTPPQARHDEDNNSGGSNAKNKSRFFSIKKKGEDSYPAVKLVSSTNTETATSSSAVKRQSTVVVKGPAGLSTIPGGPEEKWGSAVAAMRRNGEVVWKVKLNPGMGVRLGLEYECRVPAGDVIIGL